MYCVGRVLGLGNGDLWAHCVWRTLLWRNMCTSSHTLAQGVCFSLLRQPHCSWERILKTWKMYWILSLSVKDQSFLLSPRMNWFPPTSWQLKKKVKYTHRSGRMIFSLDLFRCWYIVCFLDSWQSPTSRVNVFLHDMLIWYPAVSYLFQILHSCPAVKLPV